MLVVLKPSKSITKSTTKRFITITVSLFILGCGGSDNDTATIEAESIADIFERDRAKVLEQLATSVIPDAYQALVDKTTILVDASAAFCATPSSALLDDLQNQWRETKSAHGYTEAMAFGEPVDALDGSGGQSRSRRLYIRDVSESQMIDRLNTLISSDEIITENIVSDANITVQGLQALEYILFDGGADSQIGNNSQASDFAGSDENVQRCNYVTSASENINTIATAILNGWLPEGDNFAEQLITAGQGSTEYADQETALDDVFSVLNSMIQVMRDDKLGELIESANPTDAESWRAKQSLNNFQNNLEGIFAVYSGSDLSGNDGFGADDFYRITTAESIGEQNIQTNFSDVRSGIEVVFEPFSTAVETDFGVIRLELLKGYTAVLAVDLETKIFPALTGSSSDFNFNDGD